MWRNAKTRALLQILAGERGRVFPADELIEYLWPGEELSLRSAASNLRNRVAELRKILEPQIARGEQSRYILTRHGGYLFSAEGDCWVDTEEFSRCEERGRRAYAAGRWDEAIAAFEGACALYRGEYLSEERYAEWALPYRERWRERVVEVLSLLADSLARRGQYGAALGYVERALGESPLDERLYRQLMVYACCAGERARAVRAYERCRAVLERELGERPSSQTEEIFRQIRAEDIPQRIYPKAAEGLAVLRVPVKIVRPPFVGRVREWERLCGALSAARRGAGRLVLMCGEAGVGKTRLGEEFARWAQERAGAQVLCGRCYELENPLMLSLWVDTLREGISLLNPGDLKDVPSAWLAEMAELLPELRRVLPQLPQGVLPPEHRQYRLFETLWSILRALTARAAPLVLFLDDLQWADFSSLDFLCYLLERLASEALLLVGTARSEELTARLERVRDQGARVGRLEEIVLGRLSEREIGELVQSLADELEVTADFGGRLYRESMGNPLFAVAVLQGFFENGAFVREGARWRLADPSRIELAPSAVRLIERRVRRVSTAAQRVLQIVACAVQIEGEVLEAAWDGTGEELFVLLGELVGQGLLSERGGRYEFAHERFREVVYGRLEEPQRIWLHRRIAQALERVYADPAGAGLAGQLAQHYEQGGQPVQALEWIFKAVNEHGKRYHLEEGLQVAEQGLRLLQKLAGRLPERERLEKEFDLMLEQLDLLFKGGHTQAAQENVERLLTLAERLGVLHQAKALHWQAFWHTRTAQYQEALRYAQEALKLSDQHTDATLKAVILDQIGLIHFCMGNYRTALEYYQQSLEIFRTRDRLKEAHAWNDCANALVKLGEYRQALKHYEASLKLYRELQEQKKASAILNNIGATLRYCGEYYQALRSLEQACAIDRTTGDRLGLGFSLCNLAQTYRLLGCPQEALTLSEEAYQIFSSVEDPFGQCMMERWLGVTYRELGDYERAQDYVKRALEKAQAIEAQAEEGECLLEIAQILLDSGDHNGSLQSLQQALQLGQRLAWSYLITRIYLVQGAVYLAQGDAQNALSTVQAALELITQHGWGGELPIRAHYLNYRILRALNHPDAAAALRAAQTKLLTTAQQITDNPLRERFLSIPLHRQILQETPVDSPTPP